MKKMNLTQEIKKLKKRMEELEKSLVNSPSKYFKKYEDKLFKFLYFLNGFSNKKKFLLQKMKIIQKLIFIVKFLKK